MILATNLSTGILMKARRFHINISPLDQNLKKRDSQGVSREEWGKFGM